jgi:hypothetical protein
VLYQTELALDLESAVGVGRVEVHLFLCISSMWADSLWWHFGKEGCQICGVGETLLGVFESQPSPVYAQDT